MMSNTERIIAGFMYGFLTAAALAVIIELSIGCY